MAVGKGFYIILQDNKYDLIPNTGDCPEALAFVETTEEVHNLLLYHVWATFPLKDYGSFLTELERLSNFPLVQKDMLSFYKRCSFLTLRPLEDCYELR